MKNNDTSLKPYFLVPLKVFQDKRLNHTLVNLYRYMVATQGENDDAYPLIETICKDLNLSHTTVSQGLNHLEEYGYLKILHKKDKRGRSRYIVETDFLKIQGVSKTQDLETKPCSSKDPEDYIDDDKPYESEIESEMDSHQGLETKPPRFKNQTYQGLETKPTLPQNPHDDSKSLQGVGNAQGLKTKPPKLPSKLPSKIPIVIKGSDDPHFEGASPPETPDASLWDSLSEEDELTQIWLSIEHTSGRDMDNNPKFVKRVFRKLLRRQYSFDELKSALSQYDNCGGKEPDYWHKFNIKSLLTGTVDSLLKQVADRNDYYTENEEVI